MRHRDEQTRYCNLHVLPVIGDLYVGSSPGTTSS